MKRFLTTALRHISLLIVAAIAVMLLLREPDAEERAATIADFLDRDENGHITAAEFDGVRPDRGLLPKFEFLRRLTISNTVVDQQLLQELSSLRNLVALSLAGCEINNVRLLEFRRLSRFKELDLSGTSIGTGDFDGLNFPGLTTLKLNDCDWVDDETLQELSTLGTLQALQLRGTEISDDGVKHLASLPSLRHLTLDRCINLTDQTLQHLGMMKSLRSGRMSGRNLSLKAARQFYQESPSVDFWIPLADFSEMQSILDQTFAFGETAPETYATLLLSELTTLRITHHAELDYSPLADLPNLSHLHIWGATVDDDVLRQLPRISGLTSLNISKSAVTDAAIDTLLPLKSLESLNLSDTQISNATIGKLEALPHLQALDISRTNVTDEGLADLKRLEGLRSLKADGLQITNLGLEYLLPWKSIEWAAQKRARGIDLSRSSVTGSGLILLADAPLNSATLTGLRVRDSDLNVIKSWRSITSLDLSDTLVTGDRLDLTRNLNLNRLLLDRTLVSDATLSRIELPDSLYSLSLSGTSVTGETLSVLSDTSVALLDVSNTPLSASGLSQALQLNARWLSLRGTPKDSARSLNLVPSSLPQSLVLDADSPLTTLLAEVSDSTPVSSLTLVGASDEHLTYAAKIPTLQTLTLSEGQFDRDGFRALAYHPGLTSLFLTECEVSRDAIKEIAEIHGLSVIQVFNRQTLENSNAFKSLQQARPDLTLLLRSETEAHP